MTDLSAEQNAMLERLCRNNFLGWEGKGEFLSDPNAMAALRELLLAVQERDAEIAKCEPRVWGPAPDPQTRIAERIKAQTYSDLFPEETK